MAFHREITLCYSNSPPKKLLGRGFSTPYPVFCLNNQTKELLSELKSFSDVRYNGVATISRIDKIIGLFCRILALLYGSSAKETYNLIDPTNISHFIAHEPGSMSACFHKCNTTYVTYHI